MGDAGRSDTSNLGFLMAKASQRWNDLLAERFRARGFGEVRPSYGSVLLPLFEEDDLRMGEIARRARLSKQTMTTLVRLCERDGLVDRTRDPGDARAFRIRLAPRALAFKPVADAGLGEFYFDIRADAATGVIDMFAGPTKDHMAVFPTRAVPLPDGHTAYSFTMFQTPGMPDELFEAQHQSLRREFANIEKAFG